MTDLFEWGDKCHHHTGDPQTSKEAAKAARVFANGHAVIAYKHLENSPATATEIAAAAGMEIYQIRRRITDLSHAGKIRRTGATRPTPSGRQECEWEVVV